ncbi:hypothetical protein HRbin08_00483 [bacterium HR08]|nr:hypothetical protein HRbin08_00483 [bacterium HR08]
MNKGERIPMPSQRLNTTARSHRPGLFKHVRPSAGKIMWVIGLLLSALLMLLSPHSRFSSDGRLNTSPREPLVLPPEARAGLRTLAESVLHALRTSDRAALEQLALTRSEFCERLWPKLPSVPNLTCEWTWSAYAPQNAEGLDRLLREHSGREYTLIRIAPQRIASYGEVRVYERVRMIVMDESGQIRALRLSGSICELDGAFRVCSFILD